MKKLVSILLCSLVIAMPLSSCKREAIIEDITSHTFIDNESNSGADVVSLESTVPTSSENTAPTSSKSIASTTSSKTTVGEKINSMYYPTKKTKIKLAHKTTGGASEKSSVTTVLKQMEKDYPNIEVSTNFISGDYGTKMYANLAAGTEPDVFVVADRDFGAWVKAGVLENLSPYIKNTTVLDTSKMIKSAISRYTYNGKEYGKGGDIYVICKDISPRALFYNKDLLKKYGVAEPSKTDPMNYDEFVSFLQKLTHPEDGVWGITQVNWEGWIRSHGASLLSADHKSSNLDDAKLQDSFQKMSDLIHKYKVTPTSTQLGAASGADILFQTQQAACFDGGSYYIMNIRGYGFDFDVCPLPGFSEDPFNNGHTGSVGYAVSTRSKNKNAAYLVAEYFGGRTAQKIMTDIGYGIPLYLDMANDPAVLNPKQKPYNMSVFVKAAEYQQPMDIVYTDNDQWYTVFQTRVRPLWNDPNSRASTIFPSIKKEIDTLLKR